MDVEWCAPAACSLPLADRPGRVAEWDALFTEGVCEVSPFVGGVRFVVDRTVAGPAVVADLVDRESRCCSFFTFQLTVGAEVLALTVGSDPAHADVVATLTARATALSAARR